MRIHHRPLHPSLGVEGGDGSSLTVNIPTVGRIPGGASVERMIDTPFLTDENIMLNLHQGDFSTTTKVSEASLTFVVVLKSP